MDSATQDLINVGKKAFKNREFESAAQCFRAIVDEGNQFPDLLNLLGVIYHHQGEFNHSIESFKNALVVNPDYVEARLNLAILYNDLGDYKDARKLYKKLGTKAANTTGPAIDPILQGSLANQHASMGDAYRRLAWYQDAIAEYKMSLKLAPHYADVRTKYAIALRENGKASEATRELKKVLRQKANYLEARIQLGLTFFMQGKKKEAIKEWKAVLKRDSGHPKAHMFLSIEENGNSPSHVGRKKPATKVPKTKKKRPKKSK
jgi:tetratricopeptide (TPR) repeat protein